MQTVVFLVQTKWCHKSKGTLEWINNLAVGNTMKEYTNIRINVMKDLCLIYIQEPYCKGLHKTPHQQTEGILHRHTIQVQKERFI